jgi:molybdate transport system substrate-binding protein
LALLDCRPDGAGGTAFDDQDVPDGHSLSVHAWRRRETAAPVFIGMAHADAARRGMGAPDPGEGSDMSARIAGLSSMATRHILADLARDYEALSRIQVDIRSMGGVEAAKLVRAGEPTDVVVLASKVMKSLEAEGHVVKDSIRDFARSEIAIAIPAGSPRPGVGSEQAVRQAILDARCVCYSTGPSGDHLKALCEKWGVAGSVLDRALVAPPGVPVASLVARGDADLGFQQLSELMGQPGIEIAGALPPEIQAVTVFSAGVSSKSVEPKAAHGLVAYLASAESGDAKRRYGMDPA